MTDDLDAKNLIGDLEARGWQVLGGTELAATSQLAAVRLSPGGEAEGGVVVDVLFASSGVEPELVAAAEPVEVFPGAVVPVAQPGHLIALKVLSRDDRRRPLDAADLRALLNGADDPTLESARAALALVTARGFDRGRDLEQDLRAAIRQFGQTPGR